MEQPPEGRLDGRDGAALARRAAAAVDARLADRPPDGRLPTSARLRAVGATFVTLESQGALLGCMGAIDAARPRYLDAMRNAVRAAADPRLPPVTAVQWPGVDVTVSVLSGLEPLMVHTVRELAALLRPGTDGLVLTDGRRQATFLPSVWHKIDQPDRFIAALLHKGGWQRGRLWPATPPPWPADLTAARYTTVTFTDRSPRPPVAGSRRPATPSPRAARGGAG